MRKLTIEHIRKEFAKDDYDLLSTEYVNCEQKLEYRCPKGHYGSITWDCWRRGQRCPECAGKKKKTIEFIREQFKMAGYELLSTKYVNNQTKLECICPQGHHWFVSWNNFQRGARCRQCAILSRADKDRLDIEYIKESFTKEGYQLLTETYINGKTKLECICPQGHYCFIRWNDFQQGHRCPKCFFENMKGSNNPNFNPNLIDEDRIKGRYISGYEEWAYNVKKRDNFTCQVCGDNKGGNLVSHHLNSYNNYPALRTALENGICICETCHKEFHHMFGYGNNTREQFEEFRKIMAAKKNLEK